MSHPQIQTGSWFQEKGLKAEGSSSVTITTRRRSSSFHYQVSVTSLNMYVTYVYVTDKVF